jgi:hypothetical protein
MAGTEQKTLQILGQHPNHQTSGAAQGGLLLQHYLLLMALLPCLVTSSVVPMITDSFCVLLITVSSLQISALSHCIQRSSFKEYSTVLGPYISPTFLWDLCLVI